MNTTENNKLIAEFMGVFNKIHLTHNSYSWNDAPYYFTTEKTKEKVIDNISRYVKYSTDWNWLMEVVNKILNISVELDTMDKYYDIIDRIPEIESVYKECITFIDWYNSVEKE